MTSRPGPRPARATRRAGGAALVLVASLTLASCGLGSAVVGVRDAPTENTSAAAVTEESAQQIAARVIDAARKAELQTGQDAAITQAEVLTGAALAVAQAATATHTHSAAPATPAPLATPEAPKVIAVSQGRTWPRAILATTLDATGNKQYLHVLISTSPTAPFQLAATVPMQGGATIPALGTLADGAKLVPATDGSGMAASPTAVLTQYAAALDYPKPTTPAVVSTSDEFAAAIVANAKAQAAGLGALGSLTQKQAVVPEDTISFRLADGGAVTFGLLRRTDTITLDKSAKELQLPPTYARLIGGATVTTSVTVVSLEPVAFVIPVAGVAMAVGGTEQIASVVGH